MKTIRTLSSKIEAEMIKRNQASLEKSTNSKASLRKAIILSFMGLIVIPILFNIFSIKPMIDYVHLENQKIKKYFWLFFYLILQIGSAITALQLQHFNCSRFFTN